MNGTFVSREHDTIDLSADGLWHGPCDERDALLAQLRLERPVSWQRPVRSPLMNLLGQEDPPGYWAVVRHEDIVTVSRHADAFSSAAGGVTFEELPPEVLEASSSILKSRSTRMPAGGFRLPHRHRDRGVPAMGVAGDDISPHRVAAVRTFRRHDRARRQSGHVLQLREPRPFGIRRTPAIRCDPQAQSAPGVRGRREQIQTRSKLRDIRTWRSGAADRNSVSAVTWRSCS